MIARTEAIKAWEKAWDELPQEQIQAWIERIPFHIERIIALEGDNEYKEGSTIYSVTMHKQLYKTTLLALKK